MSPTGEESDEQTRGAAGRLQQDGGASASFRVRVGRGNFCLESGVYDYRGGCGGSGYGGGRR